MNDILIVFPFIICIAWMVEKHINTQSELTEKYMKAQDKLINLLDQKTFLGTDDCLAQQAMNQQLFNQMLQAQTELFDENQRLRERQQQPRPVGRPRTKTPEQPSSPTDHGTLPLTGGYLALPDYPTPSTTTLQVLPTADPIFHSS